MKALISMEQNTVKVHLAGKMAPAMWVNSSITTSQARVSTNGATDATTKASGREIKCTATGCSNGTTAVFMRARLSTTVKKVKAH